MLLSLHPRRVAPVALVLAMTMRAAASGPQTAATSGAPPGPRTGLIVGQVVDSSGAPVPEAIVMMSLPRYGFDLPTTPKGRVMADGEGRFFFAALPAGDYYLRAAKDGYGGGAYGQRRVSTDSQPLSLGEGERRTDAKLVLWKYAAVGGTVIDEAGEPVVGISVRALLKDIVGGRTRYGSAPWLVPTTTTDDRGMFRLSQLTPATYVIVAPSTQTTVPAAAMSAPDPAARNELFFAGVSEVSVLGQPRLQQFGEFALMTLNSVLIPPPPSPAGRLQVYRTTYFPGATTAGAASAITVKDGEERTDITITLRPVPAVRIAGRLVGPDGSAPPPMAIRLAGDAMSDVVTASLPNSAADVGFETVTGLSDASGRFMLLGVPPGDYVLTHGNPFVGDATRQGRAPYWIAERLSVGTEDMTDLVVNLRPALRVEGRLAFVGANGPQQAPAISGLTFDSPFGERGFAVQTSRGTTTFATMAAAGRYVARAQETGGWFVKSVTLEGKDITDRAFDLQADATSFIVTYTNQPSKVAGTVKSARGDVSPSAIVLAYPVDQQRWTGYGPNPRNVRSTTVSAAGIYTFANLPPGDYYVIAIDDAEADGWKDPKTLEMLARQAAKLTIGEAQSNTLDLVVKAVR